MKVLSLLGLSICQKLLVIDVSLREFERTIVTLVSVMDNRGCLGLGFVVVLLRSHIILQGGNPSNPVTWALFESDRSQVLPNTFFLLSCDATSDVGKGKVWIIRYDLEPLIANVLSRTFLFAAGVTFYAFAT